MLKSQSVLVEHQEVDLCEEAGVVVVARRGDEEVLAIEGEEVQEEVPGEGALVPGGEQGGIPTLPGHRVAGARSERRKAFGRIFGKFVK